jgi:hypothetical protein
VGFFQTAKDRLLESTAPAVLNESLMRPYGQITSLKIDSTDKTLRLEALLRGEKEKISVEVLSYEIVKRDGEVCFVAKEVRTSREWITTLAREQIVGKPIPVPAQLSSWVTRLL